MVEENLALRRRMGDRMGTASGLSVLGMAALDRGDPEAAKSFIVESLTLSSVLGQEPLIAENLEVLAGISGEQGFEMRAAQLWGAAEALREAIGIPQPHDEKRVLEPFLEAARSRLDEATFRAAWEEGRVLTEEQAIALALESSDESEAKREAETA